MTLNPANKRALLLGAGALALVAVGVWALRDAGIPVPPNARAPAVAGACRGTHNPSPAIASARAAEPLLANTSSYSACGTLSATTPAPAW